MSQRMWEAVETKTGKGRVAETERRRDKRGSRKKVRRKRKGEEAKIEKTEEGEDNKSKENSREVGNLG